MTNYRKYWEKNIERWGEFYLEISHGHEHYDAPAWLGTIYRATIGRIESRLMRERFELTSRFIDEFVTAGCVFADIGCGTGIFTVAALKRGARVHAIDFSERALEITQSNVRKYIPDGDVSYHQVDVQLDALPKSDVAIMIGVAPYVANLEACLESVLVSTNVLLCQYVEPKHWANRIRRALPILNVRQLIFHSAEDVDALYERHRWKLMTRRPFATGILDIASAGAIDRPE